MRDKMLFGKKEYALCFGACVIWGIACLPVLEIGGLRAAAPLLLLVAGSLLYASELFAETPYRLLMVLLMAGSPWICHLTLRQDLKMLLFFAILPFLGFSMAGFERTGKWVYLLPALSGAVLPYLHPTFGFGILLCMIVYALLIRRPAAVATGAVGLIAGTPLLRGFLPYLHRGQPWREDVFLGQIQSRGYVFGQFFHSYTYRANQPGLGIGIWAGVLLLAYLKLTAASPADVAQEEAGQGKEAGQQISSRHPRLLWITVVILLWMSSIAFPWDALQKVASPLYRLIGSLESPYFFAWFAGFLLIPPAVRGIRGLCARRPDPVRTALLLFYAGGALVTMIYRLQG